MGGQEHTKQSRPLMLRRSASLALLVAALAGCGTNQPTARARDGRVAVTLDDFRFDPQVIRAEPGRLRFDLVNRGRLAHTFRLRRFGKVVAKVPSLLPGERATKSVRVREGDYLIVCELANHEELGMNGTLQVR
jgi:plastocyanin